MGKHTAGPGHAISGLWRVLVLVTVVALAVTVSVLGRQRASGGEDAQQVAQVCDRTLRVLTASSFAPVLDALEPALGQGEDCLRLDVQEADGRDATSRLATTDADVWIPDDASWEGLAPSGVLVPAGTGGSGTVLATSPIYIVSDRKTSTRIEAAGASWSGLAKLLTGKSGMRLLVTDPRRSGDGMVAVGSLAEAVWIDDGMDASAVALARLLPVTRIVSGSSALPTRAGEVGLVPEYAWLAAPTRKDARIELVPGTDHTATLRFAWFPTAAAADDPMRAPALARLRSVLTGPEGRAAIDAAGLREPALTTPPARAAQRVPAMSAKPFPVLGGHHVDHVFASWYRADRRMNLTMVVDVSWSMSEPAPGSRSPLIAQVRKGAHAVGKLLPDESRLGLWAFGSRLDGPRDYRVLLPTAPLGAGHRRSLASAIDRLEAERTGTGLYDTILAAYTRARDAYRPGASNQVMVFTDGLNEDDPGSISLGQLTRRLVRATDPRRPVELSVVAFGQRPEVEALTKALDPVKAYVEPLETSEEVDAMFIHLATGGLHADDHG